MSLIVRSTSKHMNFEEKKKQLNKFRAEIGTYKLDLQTHFFVFSVLIFVTGETTINKIREIKEKR